MTVLKKYEKLECYNRAISLAAEIIPYCNELRPYRLSEQISASVLSISSNIAEGVAYQNDKDFIRFLRYARGSAAELDSQLLVLLSINKGSDQLIRWRHEVTILLAMITNLQKAISRKHSAANRS